MTKKRGAWIAAALAASALLTGALPAAASDGPVDDVRAAIAELSHCRAWADEPGGDPVVGWGGANNCRSIIGTVCLVYNGVTVGSSCNILQDSDGSASSPTKPTRCLPGLWQTQTTVIHAQGEDTEVVSDFVLLVCLPRINH